MTQGHDSGVEGGKERELKDSDRGHDRGKKEENVAEEWEGSFPTEGEVSYIVCVIGFQIPWDKKSPHSRSCSFRIFHREHENC